MGEERERKATRAGLRSAAPRLRAEIGRQIRLRFLPDIEFREDDTVERGDRVEELIRKIHRREEP